MWLERLFCNTEFGNAAFSIAAEDGEDLCCDPSFFLTAGSHASSPPKGDLGIYLFISASLFLFLFSLVILRMLVRCTPSRLGLYKQTVCLWRFCALAHPHTPCRAQRAACHPRAFIIQPTVRMFGAKTGLRAGSLKVIVSISWWTAGCVTV